MSLKSKIEAVIYAAEEPVTLSQLVAIFAAEVPLPASSVAAAGASPEPQQISLDEATAVASPAASETWGTPVASEAEPAVFAEGTETSPPAAPAPSPREVREYLRMLVDELVSEYLVQDRGIEIREIAGGFRMATKPEYHDAVRAFVKSLKPPMKLSLQALETLAVIAYKQPVTAPEVAEIRGVDSGGVLAGLISRKLVTTAGRKQVIGRPILYKTTKEFLMRFGLKDVAELPSMEEFEKMAGELAESDALEASAMQDRAGVEPLPFGQTDEGDALEAAPPPAQTDDEVQAHSTTSHDEAQTEESIDASQHVSEMQER